jgi:hypothetical protein
MISLALALVMLGIADLAMGGLAATPEATSKRSRVMMTAFLSLLAAYGYYRYTTNFWISASYFTILWSGSTIWLTARSSMDRRWLIASLVALAGTLLITAMVIPTFVANEPVHWISQYLAKLPWQQLRNIDPNAATMLLAMALFLGPTSNGIVRTCLQIIRSTPVAESEKTLKGGRFIGPLERLLIFGLALAGQPTAAALIISAKSIIRFPELQSKGVQDRADGNKTKLIDELTEYFLLGSLLSWSLALLAALPFIDA